MAFSRPGGPSSAPHAFQQAQPFQEAQFDIIEWYPQFLSCLRFFLDHSQYSSPVQAVAAFVNIQLPFQKSPVPILSYKTLGSPPGLAAAAAAAGHLPPMVTQPSAYVTLQPYIRRLVATGYDVPPILHGFFGDDWEAGIGRLHDAERRNYLFAAKSDTWLGVKTNYDMDDGQTIPFLRPLQNVSEKEILSAESYWSEWLAMQDWMLGPRAPEEGNYQARPQVKNEED